MSKLSTVILSNSPNVVIFSYSNCIWHENRWKWYIIIKECVINQSIPNILFSKNSVSDCPLQWEMSFHVRSNRKPFLIYSCTPISQTSSKTTWWCVAISHCVNDRTLQLLHPSHPPWFGYPSNIWWWVQILKLIRMLLFSNFVLIILFMPQHPVL
jgi:hypothetical protein